MLKRSILWVILLFTLLLILISCSIFGKLNEQEFWTRDEHSEEIWIDFKGVMDVNSPNVICSTVDGNHIFVGTSDAVDQLKEYWRDCSSGWLNGPSNTVTFTSGIFAIAVSPNGKFVYVHDLNTVYWGTINEFGGFHMDPVVDRMPVAANMIDEIIIPNDSFHIYIATFNTIYWYSIDPASGALKTPTGTNSINVNYGINHITISPDGRFVYVSSGNFQVDAVSTIKWFERDFETGELKGDQVTDAYQKVDGTDFYNLTIPKDGKHMYCNVGGPGSPIIAICSLKINTSTGELSSFKPQYIGEPDYMTFSLDGKQLFTAYNMDNNFKWYTRDKTTGNLIEVNGYFDTTANQANHIIATPDGKNVYGSAFMGGSGNTGGIIFFERNVPGGH